MATPKSKTAPTPKAKARDAKAPKATAAKPKAPAKGRKGSK